jgi:predicted esterase
VSTSRKHSAAEWDALSRRVFEGYAEEDFGTALVAAEQAAREFPDRESHAAYWRASLLARMGNVEEAERVLAEAVEHGGWWSVEMLRGDDDLGPLQGRLRFEELVEVCDQRQREANLTARPQLVVVEPTRRATTTLLLALHGRAENAQETAERWRPARAHAIVAAPQSSQAVGSGSYAWDDLELGGLEVADAYRQIAGARPVERVVLGGFSQGGALALAEALAGSRVPADGFVVVAPSIGRVGLPDVYALRALLPAAVARGIRGAIVSGDRDVRGEDAEMFARDAEWAGLPLHHDVVQDVGHEFPPDFGERLLAGLDFVLDVDD